MISTDHDQERVILVAAAVGSYEDAEDSLDELSELAATAGAAAVGRVIQNLDRIHPGTYIGTGKIEEVRSLLYAYNATGVICDDELSPAQLGNLEHELDCKVMDRTLLILDIFAQRAQTSEGKIQVELAQLRYRASRLVGLRASLSRLGGGIGTRGPGEKKLEMDRRLIRSRISALKEELENVERHRTLLRTHRKSGTQKTAAIVGYTNAGKSSLLNRLTDAGILAEDKLFATLDPTTRVMNLPDGQSILLTDTVGFIRKLPHHLVEAFKSTLEEAVFADYLIHVVDASNPQAQLQMQVVYDTLRELKALGKPVITLLNKQDLGGLSLHDPMADHVIKFSVKTGLGTEQLEKNLMDLVNDGMILIERLIPYTDGQKLALARDTGKLLQEEYTPEGIRMKALVPREIYGRI